MLGIGGDMQVIIQIARPDGALADLFDQGKHLQAFRLRLAPLYGLSIDMNQHGHDADRHQMVSSLNQRLFRHKQARYEGSSLTLEVHVQPEGKSERNNAPVHFLILGHSFYLLSEKRQALCIAALEESSRLHQGT